MDYPEKVEKALEKSRPKDGSLFVDIGTFLKIDVPYPIDGDRWGRWRFDAKSLQLVLEESGQEAYVVELAGMNSSAQMMDWIFQVNMKAWATREDIGNLVKALDDLLRPQSTLCSDGADKRIDATKYLRQKLASGEVA